MVCPVLMSLMVFYCYVLSLGFIYRTDQTRWLEALTHPAKEKQKEDEKIYETWGKTCHHFLYIYHFIIHFRLSTSSGRV